MHSSSSVGSAGLYIIFTTTTSDIYSYPLQLELIHLGVNGMLSLGIRPGLIASHTIVINDTLSYQVRLSKLCLEPDTYRLDIRATTTLGRLTIQHTCYHDFATAQQAFNHQRRQLESH